MNNIAVVICTYNKREYVMDCIESVFKSNYSSFDLIVVDNASTDGSVEAVSEKYGEKLTLLVNDENKGGSGGFNRGMAFAMEKKQYKYIHLLDDDVIVDTDAICKLYDFMEENADVGLCGSLVMKMGMKDYIQDLGAMIDIDGFDIRQLYVGQMRSGDIPEYVECDYVAACSAMYRVSALEITGIINAEYFIYWDDMSLGWEMRIAGYRVCAYSQSVVWHYGAFASRNMFRRYYLLRNKIYSFVKYIDDAQYSVFCENLVKRFFRMFSVNRDNPEFIYAYFHALDDAINNVRGKANSYKLVFPISSNKKFAEYFSEKRSILIKYDKTFHELDTLLNRIWKATNATIHVLLDQQGIPIVDGIEYVNTADVSRYDAIVQLCYHILDVGEYDRGKIYIDRYANHILDSSDFDFYSNYDLHFDFFHDVFYEFIKSKLDALRARIH